MLSSWRYFEMKIIIDGFQCTQLFKSESLQTAQVLSAKSQECGRSHSQASLNQLYLG